MAPNNVIACVHRTLSRIFPWPFLPALFPRSATILAPHMSIPYSILGITTVLLNRRRVNLFLMPRDGLARRRQARAYFVPLATALASCSLKRSSSSMMIPKNLCDLTGLVVRPAMVMGMHFFGMVFLGFAVLFSLLQEAWTRVFFSISKLTWCVRLHSKQPPHCSIITCILQLEAGKVGPRAMNMMSSMKPAPALPFFLLGMSRMSALKKRKAKAERGQPWSIPLSILKEGEV